MTEKFKHYPKTDILEIIDTYPIDHKFELTKAHLLHAQRFNDGKISPRTIMEVETTQGRSCGAKGCTLYYKQHRIALVVEVNFAGDVNEAPGLEEYLQSCKPYMLKDGVAGFVFIRKNRNKETDETPSGDLP